MKNHVKALLITVISLALGWTMLLTIFTCSVAEELTLLRREKLGDNLYLRYRIQELDSSITSLLLQKQPQPIPPTGDTSEGNTEGGKVEDPTEEITLPTHQSPETVPPEEPVSLYILSEHNGILGIFNAEGELLDTVNVFVMTLPQADRDALAVGIPAYSVEEISRLIAQYE